MRQKYIMKLILASGSPRRKQLLATLRNQFDIIPSAVDEISTAALPKQKAVENACRKAVDVYKKNTDACVIGCDTVVDLDGDVLGKPVDSSEAKTMLTRLSGRTHSVHTGICIICPKGVWVGADTSVVLFRDLSECEIYDYVATGSPLDKAGSYGIQDSDFVRNVDGSYNNVMGFPTEIIAPVLDEFLD